VKLDVDLVDSQHGDRVLFEAQLLLASRGPQTPSSIGQHVAKATGLAGVVVRETLNTHRRRFESLPDGRLGLSPEALA
jgi:hypothetical protein